MIGKSANSHTRYKLVTILMLLAGLGSALAIYLTAGNPDEIGMVEEFEESKRFAHDLELYGGKANLIANKFSRWFEGLWHGQSLAYTVAVFTVVIAGGYFLVARRLAAHAAADDADESSRGETEGRR